MIPSRVRISFVRLALAYQAVAVALSASSAHAVLGTFNTSGVYDEQVTNEQGPGGGNFMNAVDVEAAGNNITLAQFKTEVLNAYNTNKGGVISFDNDTNAIGAGDAQFVSLVGVNQSNLLTVTRTDGTLNNNNNHPVISGFNYLGLTTASPCTLAFSPFTLESFAITALGRASGRTVTLSIIYDDNTEQTFPMESLGNETTGDLFFGWKAPAPRTIKGVRFVANNFIRYDDMGLILANFQPGDADGDFDVDANDYNLIRTNFGLTPATKAQGDVTGDGMINLADFQLWKANEVLAAGGLSAPVPEPSSAALALLGLAASRRRSRMTRAR